MNKRRNFLIALVVVILTQGCMPSQINPQPALPTSQNVLPAATRTQVMPTAQSATLVPTQTLAAPTETALPKVTISAVKGNLFIRRGPGLAYNPIGVLVKGTSADVIARDVLSDWVQVAIPDSDHSGWVSIQTDYSSLEGELSSVPDFTFTDWPVPAYLYNCSEHDMYIMPGEIVLTSYFTHPNNQVWLNPGTYTVYDYVMPGRPQVKKVEMREGMDQAILYDGTGTSHKCP
ncbi:MAG: SH3 domain-containing protein [Chloroflexi bacterium]|nr:SH3 domain-containing protein [Chloroflexota bacterium]